MNFPNIEQIEKLHRKYAPHEKAFESVFTHCKIVAEIAMQLLDKLPEQNINRELVKVGCLFHDIGVYRLFKEGGFDQANYICHGVLGEAILREEGLPELICRFASHHIGVGITKEEIIKNNLPLPHKDFFAETEEELLVMYADKFHSKTTPPRFNTSESYKKSLAQFFGQDKIVKFEEMIRKFGLPDLEMLRAKDGHIVV